MKKHHHTLVIFILLFTTQHINAEKTRGSIISADNQIIAQTINDVHRGYPSANTLQPLLGYVTTEGKGRLGIEKSYNDVLSQGKDIYLNISLSLQKKVEHILDSSKAEYEADEVIAAVMESATGKVVTMASSNRYNGGRIMQKDIPSLISKFTEYPYEPGAIINPLTVAIAIEHGVVTPTTWINTHNGKLEIGEKYWITDDEEFESLTVTDIIVHSSNVGISQISWKLTGKAFRDGLLQFGFGKPSGIDLHRDLTGAIKSLKQLDHKLHRANTSYGYGIMTTFTQLMKAYTVFNNEGKAITPTLVNDTNRTENKKEMQIISKKTANQIYTMLLEAVKRGRGISAQYQGLEIAGNTGTAHIAKNGRYVREYHTSFYGFANDSKGHKYTIGVLVIRAKKKYRYFASQSAVPVFRKLVEAMVLDKYLTPEKK